MVLPGRVVGWILIMAYVPLSPVQRIGQRTIQFVEYAGELVLFVIEMVSWMVSRRPFRNTLIPNMYQIGVQSVPVVALTGTFIGMVLAVQAYYQFETMNLETRLGSVINRSLTTELGPVLAATMLAGRIGGAMSAQIGTMKVTEQIDALRTLGANPIHYLVVPRFIACVMLIPLLTIMADFMGIIGGAIVSTRILHVEPYHYWLHSRNSVGLWEVFLGIFKSIFFGAEIAIISCHRGFMSGSGAEGVGRSATEAFVLSFIAILVSDFFLGIFLETVHNRYFPELTSRMM